MSIAVVMNRPKERAPYQPMGGAYKAWRSGHPEVLLCGPADTGKSRGILEKLHFCADKYAGARILMVRKTRVSLSQTGMVTYEKKVLPRGWFGSLIRFNTVEQQYEYPNESIIAVGGMDNPEKVLSSEWDMIYPQEATEFTLDDWEILGMRLRNGTMPYQQLLGDCNPGPPTHWLKRRCDRGATKYIASRHADNPSITPDRLARLDRLTGVRRKRYRDGIWAAAEGMVYDTWDRDIHLVSKQQLTDWQVLAPDGSVNRLVIKHLVAGVDWGYRNAGILNIFGVDGDERLYLLREVYFSQRTIDWWIAEAQQLTQEFRSPFGSIETWICDPSEPAYIRQFNEAGLNAIGAINDIAPGISYMQARLKTARDGRPRFFVYEYALKERDEVLDQTNRPYCFEQEIDAYVWAQDKDGKPNKEEPIDECNHSLDASRYVCSHYDAGVADIDALDPDIVNALSGYRG